MSTPAVAPVTTPAPATPAAPAPAGAAVLSPGAAPITSAAGHLSTPAPPTTPAPVVNMADWVANLPENSRGYAQNKGWKNPGEMLDSYQNFEKLMGAPQDKIIKMPDSEDAEGWRGVYAKLGRPQTAEEYKLPVPTENGDPNFAKAASGWFHEMGLSVKQAQAITAKFNEYQAGQIAAGKTQTIEAMTNEQNAVKTKWGAAYDQNVKVASRAAREFGMTTDVLSKMEAAMGYEKLMMHFHAIGSKLGESSFHDGHGGSGGAMTPEQAKSAIAEKMKDKTFIQKMDQKDVSALNEWNRLHQMANPGNSSF